MNVMECVPMRSAIFLILLLGLVTACAMPRLSLDESGRSADPGPADRDYISLTPMAMIHATLKASPAAAIFKISGLGTGYDVLLPSTTIAKIAMPKASITITASTPCYPDLVHYLQADELINGIDISFAFSNADRKPDCEDGDISLAAARGPSLPPSGSMAKLAWVITNSNYDGTWAPLPFVENDRDHVTGTLERAGYRVIVSNNRSRTELLADNDRFRKALTQQGWSSVIVYISGHGVGLNGDNYLVPIDIPVSAANRPSDLFPISRIVQNLHPVTGAETFLVMVDACRSNAGFVPQAPVKNDDENVLVNYSAMPGTSAFTGKIGMSAWTGQFVALADAYPGLEIDQIVRYANLYTKWQSETSQQVQTPILTGKVPTPVPPFGLASPFPPGVRVARISDRLGQKE